MINLAATPQKGFVYSDQAFWKSSNTGEEEIVLP